LLLKRCNPAAEAEQLTSSTASSNGSSARIQRVRRENAMEISAQMVPLWPRGLPRFRPATAAR